MSRFDADILRRYEEKDTPEEIEPNCYICTNCGLMFEQPKTWYRGNNRFSDSCPRCGSEEIEPTYDEALEEQKRERYKYGI